MKHLKKLLSAALCAVMLLGLTVPARAAADFADTAGHWAIEEIRWARENGVVDGVGDNRFDPEGKVANNAMVKMLVSAFFREDFNAYEQEYHQAIDIYFGGNPGWDGAMNYYALRNGLLDSVSMNIDQPASAGAGMTRNDMAMVLYNAAAKKGLTATMIVTILHPSGSYLFCAEGNHSGVIKWPKYTGSWNAFGPAELSIYGSYVALSRWPH